MERGSGHAAEDEPPFGSTHILTPLGSSFLGETRSQRNLFCTLPLSDVRTPVVLPPYPFATTRVGPRFVAVGAPPLLGLEVPRVFSVRSVSGTPRSAEGRRPVFRLGWCRCLSAPVSDDPAGGVLSSPVGRLVPTFGVTHPYRTPSSPRPTPGRGVGRRLPGSSEGGRCLGP